VPLAVRECVEAQRDVLLVQPCLGEVRPGVEIDGGVGRAARFH